MESWLERLNEMQREAVLHPGGPLLVLAGAGSGKTRTLTCRIAHLIAARGVRSERILAVTFTNKAAAEMRARVQQLVGDHRAWVATFHSTCARLLRFEAPHLGYPRDFVIYDEQDQQRLLRDCLTELKIPADRLPPQIVATMIDQCKNRGLSPAEFVPSTPREEQMLEVYRLYQRRLLASGAMDFGDLLLLVLQLFEEFPSVRERWQNQFDHILVDEYQDTNAVQYRLVRCLAEPHRNLCVVGDEDQSIYRWRGAEIRNILDFERDYPDARTIFLEQNYRSTAAILRAASAVVAHNVLRKGKTLWTENPRGDKVAVIACDNDLEEADWVTKEIQRLLHQGRKLGDVVVLYRTNAQSRVFEEAFVRARLPYTIVGGMRFFARAEVKDVLAYLRLIVNPQDSVAAKRIINTPPRGIGETTIRRVAALETEAGSFLSACRLALVRGVLKHQAAERVQRFVECVERWREQMASLPYASLAAQVLEESGYRQWLEQQQSAEAEERLRNVEELLRSLEEHAAESQSLAEFLEQAALVADVDTYTNAADRLTLMTLHAAKGLEFPVVFLVGMEEGLFPLTRRNDDEEDIEEERRLCYVGMTRAREKLYLTYAMQRRLFGSVQENEPSRFLREVPLEVVDFTGAKHVAWNWARRAAARDDRAQVSTEPEVVYDEGLRKGQRVRHPTFGIGTVLQVEGWGDDQKVVVLFQRAGRKKLVVRLAGMEPA
ncbi:MAG: UvrD-helicase domain-containing protein [Candidatus Binatia bacterium]|nr:UvrD-helicase domain-containing protein [Candidatus Binatia bacterium]